MFNLVDLTGKKIIVAGASQGIGRDTAIMLSKLGAQVIALARNEEKLKETVGMLEGIGHSYKYIDLADLNSIETCVKSIVEQNGAIDGLAYCAGIAIDYPLNVMKPETFQTVIQTNLCGFVEMVRSVTKKKRFNEGMRIVAISSVASLCGSKGHIAYSASKAGMDGAIRCMAVELASKGICINSVAPANIMTPMIAGWVQEHSGTDMFNKIMSKQYLGMGNTDDVAALISFLLSPAARFITGVCIPVDGGYTTN